MNALGDLSSRYMNSLEIQKRLNYAHRYNNWLFGQFDGYIGRRILEIGCALGNFTRKMQDRDFLCLIDIEEEYVQAAKREFQPACGVDVLRHDISRPAVLELKEKNFDTAVCFNVLEHIQDDSQALENIYQLLGKDGYLCLVVPAFGSIFGSMDSTDHHWRRYSKQGLARKIRAAGFEIIKARYLNMPGFFGWWLNGKVFKRQFIPLRQLLLYDKIIPLVSLIEKQIDPPFGQSVVLVARK